MANLEIIRKRFDEARKLYGYADKIATPSGLKVKGKYLLAESGAVTPSHDPFNSFCKSEGFPADSNGQTVNDRDYERDTFAQTVTRGIADKYDEQALTIPPIVSKDGIVLSGNGRTMAGMIAAKYDTDKDYIDYLRDFPQKYGFTTEQVESFEHPRLCLVADDDYPYTTEIFAAFNQDEKKGMSKTEDAVSMGKKVSDESFRRLIRSINTFDTIAEFYANQKASSEAVMELIRSKVITGMKTSEMFDGASNERISAKAREILENVLIGKAFQKNPDAVRQINKFAGMRLNIITALSEISTNVGLEEYSLETEMAEAIHLCYHALATGIASGQVVSGFSRQSNIAFDGEESTVADFTNPIVKALADAINSAKTNTLKKIFTLYNNEASSASSGMCDMFGGGEVKSKADIICEVCEFLKYGSAAEIREQLAKAQKTRRFDAMQQIDAESFSEEDNPKVDSNSHGVRAGDFAILQTTSGYDCIVKVLSLRKRTAFIRLKGWLFCYVSSELLLPTDRTKCTLPDWFTDFVSLTTGVSIERIEGDDVYLSDGSVCKAIDVILCASPKARMVA